MYLNILRAMYVQFCTVVTTGSYLEILPSIDTSIDTARRNWRVLSINICQLYKLNVDYFSQSALVQNFSNGTTPVINCMQESIDYFHNVHSLQKST